MANNFTTTPAAGDDDAPTITVTSQGPKKVRTDEGYVEERSINELIQADQYDKAAAASAPPYGMKVAKTRAGGTTD